MTFVYDEFMEYVLAKGMFEDAALRVRDRASTSRFFEELLEEAKEFPPTYGATGYLVCMLMRDGHSHVYECLLDQAQALDDGSSSQWISVIAASISQVGPGVDDSGVLDCVLRLVGTYRLSSDASMRILHALSRLAESGVAKAAGATAEFLNSTSPEVAARARNVLVESSDSIGEAVRALLITMSGSSVAFHRAAAMLASADINRRGYSVPVKPLIHDRDPIVRQSSVYLLASTGQYTDELAIVGALTDPDLGVVAVARALLGESQHVEQYVSAALLVLGNRRSNADLRNVTRNLG